MPKVERLPSGSYRIRYTDPWGRRAVVTRKTAADVRAVHRQIVSAMARGEYVDPRRGRTTVAEWAEDWLAGARNLGPGGRDVYRQALDDHIIPALGKIPLGKLTAGDIDRYLTDKLTTPVGTGKKARPRAPSTVHRHYRILQSGRRPGQGSPPGIGRGCTSPPTGGSAGLRRSACAASTSTALRSG